MKLSSLAAAQPMADDEVRKIDKVKFAAANVNGAITVTAIEPATK